jgi:hypothetical protein
MARPHLLTVAGAAAALSSSLFRAAWRGKPERTAFPFHPAWRNQAGYLKQRRNYTALAQVPQQSLCWLARLSFVATLAGRAWIAPAVFWNIKE